MKRFIVCPSKVTGDIAVPSSKSHTLRAILLGALGRGKTSITSPLYSPDAQAMVRACIGFGAKVEWNDTIEIEGVNGRVVKTAQQIDAGNSGIVLRFLTAVASLGSHPVLITGDHSICSQRPMTPMISAMKHLEVNIVSKNSNGYAPLLIEGGWKGGKTAIEGADSQPVSALLIAGALTPKGLEMTVNNPGEKPWIDLTLSWLQRLGVNVERDCYSYYRVPGKQTWRGFHYHVPGDWSTAGFLIAAALVTQSELSITHLDAEDCQGDKKLVDILVKQMGAKIDQTRHTLRVFPSKLVGTTVDLNDCIDTLPVLSVIACYAKGTTIITNASIARTKECNRIASIAKELRRMGAKITEQADGLKIEGGNLKGTTVQSHADHRMAMALAIAGLGATRETVIDDVACVSKTYPAFASAMQTMGARIEEIAS